MQTRQYSDMLRFWLIAGLAFAFAGPAWSQTAEFRGVWADAFHEGYKSTSEIDDLVARAVEGRYNAIVAEVMAFMDNASSAHGAYWNSSIVPKAPDISGGIDPLAYLCQQAHANGIEVHAWLVTFRVCRNWPPAGNATLSAHPEWLMVPRAATGGGPALVGEDYVLDPSSPDTQNYLISIVNELVTNYPIDGINWDYIRYTQTDAGYPASSTYLNSGLKRFQRITGRSDLPAVGDTAWSDFRRRGINELIRRCRAEVPSVRSNPSQPVAVSADLLCIGGYTGNFTQSSAYQYFQNWKYWQEQGYLDAAIPMNYKREYCPDQATQYRSWIDAAVSWKSSRHVYCGQATYLNSFEDSITQMQYGRSAGADGGATYSYVGTLHTNFSDCNADDWTRDWSWYPYVATNVYTTAVATPALTWRDPAVATEGTIWGRIVNWETGEPVDDATVQVTGFPSVKTDGNGYYTITRVTAAAAGTPYTLTVTKNAMPSGSHSAAYVFAGDVSRYDFSLGALAPRIGLNNTLNSLTWSRTVAGGSQLTDESFNVSAMGITWYGPVNYLITDNAAWLSVSPRQGSSSGELDAITVDYDTAALAPGSYVAVITVSDAAAYNNPRTVTINLTVEAPPVPGDFDHDGDVDQKDFGWIQACQSGSSNPATPACETAKMDTDSDVDGEDVARFQKCFSGAGVAANPYCLN